MYWLNLKSAHSYSTRIGSKVTYIPVGTDNGLTARVAATLSLCCYITVNSFFISILNFISDAPLRLVELVAINQSNWEITVLLAALFMRWGTRLAYGTHSLGQTGTNTYRYFGKIYCQVFVQFWMHLNEKPITSRNMNS